jgi:hypothetical protein
MCVKLAQGLKGKAGGGLANQEYEQLFPFFTWCVRNFTLALQDGAGNPMSENQYLERALVEVEGDDDDSMIRNRICKTLKKFFQHRSCFTLV